MDDRDVFATRGLKLLRKKSVWLVLALFLTLPLLNVYFFDGSYLSGLILMIVIGAGGLVVERLTRGGKPKA
ncbi:hypothetical protein [Micromonospora sp. SH-82]|uniref:hypothetical protein n=1 Tax=Micromonospora sp. SH-82 TaxID=3132938 RepID=UPI003EBCD502